MHQHFISTYKRKSCGPSASCGPSKSFSATAAAVVAAASAMQFALSLSSKLARELIQSAEAVECRRASKLGALEEDKDTVTLSQGHVSPVLPVMILPDA